MKAGGGGGILPETKENFWGQRNLFPTVRKYRANEVVNSTPKLKKTVEAGKRKL